MMEAEYAPASYEFQQHGYTPDQMEEIGNQYFSTRGQRVRAAMFPETMDEGMEIPATQMTEEPTAVEKLAEPSQLLKHAVSNIVNYQSDAENAVRIIPDLIRWLHDKDEEVVRKTTHFIHELSKKDASRFALMRDAQVVSALVKAMETASSPNSVANEEFRDTLSAAAGTLHNLSAFTDGLNVIFKSYGIPFLIKLLKIPAEEVRRSPALEKVQKYAVVTLHNLIEHQENAKGEVFKHGGIQAMVPLLRKQDHRLVTIMCDCLKHLIMGNQEAKIIILAANGPHELLQIMKMSTYEKLLYTASSVLKAISVEHHNKKEILRYKGLDILVNCAQSRSFETPRAVTNILYILRNLSDMLINDPDFKDSSFDGILELIVPLLDKQGDAGRLHPQVLCAAGILSNLTCNNQPNKMKVIHLDGIPLLLRACQRYPNREEITEPAMCTLRHITSRHPECEQARHLIHNFGGLQIIAAMLNQPSHWTLIKAIVGMIKNLAVEPTNRSPLRQLGVVNKLIDLMYQAYSLVREASPPGQFNTEVTTDNVRMHDVVETCLSSLYELAKDPSNRAIIRTDTKVISAVVPLLAHPVDNVIRSAVSVLSELSSDREGCHLIEQSGAVPGLTNLLHRSNAHNGSDSIGSYAVNTLYNLGEMEGKSGEYRNGLHIELMDVLAQSGNVMWGSSSEMPADYDYLLSGGDYGHQYHSSGPPSVHGSVYGTNLSVYDPDAMDISSHTPNAQVWEQYASATPINGYDISQNYHGSTPLPDSGSWKDSDV